MRTPATRGQTRLCLSHGLIFTILCGMAVKLSPTAQAKVTLYEGCAPHIARLHSLVEQFAVARAKREEMRPAIKRAASQTKIRFMSAGMDQLAQQCASIEMAASRGGNPNQLVRILRELIGSLKFQLDLEIRTIVREDLEAAAKAEKQEAAEETQS